MSKSKEIGINFRAGQFTWPAFSYARKSTRELKEETGLETIEVLFQIPGGYSSAGMTDEKVGIVGLRVAGEYHDVHGEEEIESFRTSPQLLWNRIMRGEQCSARMQCILLGALLVNQMFNSEE